MWRNPTRSAPARKAIGDSGVVPAKPSRRTPFAQLPPLRPVNTHDVVHAVVDLRETLREFRYFCPVAALAGVIENHLQRRMQIGS